MKSQYCCTALRNEHFDICSKLKQNYEFDVHVTLLCDKFLIINQLDTLISQIYFGKKLYMFRTVSLSIIRSFHCTHSNGICHTGLLTACKQDQNGTSISPIYFGRKHYMFRTVPLSIIRNFSLYTEQWYMSYRFADSLQAGSGCSMLCVQ